MPNVPKLPELQQGFRDAILDGGDSMAHWICGAGLEPAARLRIYRNTVAHTLSATLRTSYPTVYALVGEEFFQELVDRYRLQHPSRCGNLQQFGDALPAFLKTMAEVRQLRYLSDIARLDWLRQLSALAGDAVPVDMTTVVNLTADKAGKLRMRLHPSVQLLASPYAGLSLWQWCQEPSGHVPHPDDGPEYALLWREEGDVAMAPLDAATFCFIDTLVAGSDLASACRAAGDVDENFNPQTPLQDLLMLDLILTLTDEEHSK